MCCGSPGWRGCRPCRRAWVLREPHRIQAAATGFPPPQGDPAPRRPAPSASIIPMFRVVPMILMVPMVPMPWVAGSAGNTRRQGPGPPRTAGTSPWWTLHPLGGKRPGRAAGSGGGTDIVQVPAPPALFDEQALARALRPLRQYTRSAAPPTLDEEATATATSETRGLHPVWRQATERRYSIDLLVDTGATMAVWHRLAGELCTMLERHGAFRDVRCWALDTDGPEPRLAPFRHRSTTHPPTPVRRWRQRLADPSGRRILLVLTDGVGPAWYGAELPGALAEWSRTRPAAALQVLPRRLWHRTALRTAAVRGSATDPERPLPRFRCDAPLPGIPAGPAGSTERARIRWLPVMEVGGTWLAPWAQLIAGRAPGWTPMLAAPLTGVRRPERPAPRSMGRRSRPLPRRSWSGSRPGARRWPSGWPAICRPPR